MAMGKCHLTTIGPHHPHGLQHFPICCSLLNLVFQPILFHLYAVTGHCMYAVFYGRVLSRAESFNCGVANITHVLSHFDLLLVVGCEFDIICIILLNKCKTNRFHVPSCLFSNIIDWKSLTQILHVISHKLMASEKKMQTHFWLAEITNFRLMLLRVALCLRGRNVGETWASFRNSRW